MFLVNILILQEANNLATFFLLQAHELVGRRSACGFKDHVICRLSIQEIEQMNDPTDSNIF
jgi:hypothetical protein